MTLFDFSADDQAYSGTSTDAIAFYLAPEFVARQRNRALVEQFYKLKDGDSHRRHSTHYSSTDCAMAIFEVLMNRSSLAEVPSVDEIARQLFSYLRRLDEVHGVPSDEELQRAFFDDLIERLTPSIDPVAVHYDFTHASPRRELPYNFLRFKQNKFGQGELEMTPEAVNIYLSTFMRDIKDVVSATEHLLDENIRRGHVEAAAVEARNARNASEAFRRQATGIIAHTRRDYHSAGWHDHVPKELEEMADFVTRSIDRENAINDRVRLQLDTSDLPGEKRVVLTRIQELLDDTQRLHGKLLQEVTLARRAFYDEQDQQFLLPSRAPTVANVTQDVLSPLLGLPVSQALDLTGALDASFFPRVERALNLAHLVEHLATPKRTVTRQVFEVEERELKPFEYGQVRHTDEERVTAERYLQGEHVRLSEALTRAAHENLTVRRLIVQLALQGYCPLGFSTAERGYRSEPDGTFRQAEFQGDDLLVTSFGGSA